MNIELSNIIEVNISGEWIEVWDGSFKVTAFKFTNSSEDVVYNDPHTGYEFRTPTNQVIVGPLSAILGYRCRRPQK
jgi:hypothetical protein